jgi:hypothetical protein
LAGSDHTRAVLLDQADVLGDGGQARPASRDKGIYIVSGHALRPDNTIDLRRSMRKRAPETTLRDDHTRYCRVVPDRFALLDHLPTEGVAAEVGVAAGDYTSAILERNRPRMLHLVDLWDSERYRAGLKVIQERHRDLISAGRLQIHRGKSVDVIARFPDAQMDWIYIDTDHSYELTLAELRAAAPKIKPKGFIAGHDFCPGNVITPWPYGVVEACNKFCVEDRWQFRFLALEPRGRMSFALSRL